MSLRQLNNIKRLEQEVASHILFINMLVDHIRVFEQLLITKNIATQKELAQIRKDVLSRTLKDFQDKNQAPAIVKP